MGDDQNAEAAARIEEEQVLAGEVPVDAECPCMKVDGELCDVCRLEDAERLHGWLD